MERFVGRTICAALMASACVRQTDSGSIWDAGGLVTGSPTSSSSGDDSSGTTSAGSTSAVQTGGSGGDSGTDSGVRLDVGPDTGGPIGPTTCEQAASAGSNQGCEFWAVDLPNLWAGLNDGPPPEDQQFAVVVANSSGETQASVGVYLGDTDLAVQQAVIAIGQMHTFELAPQSVPPRQTGITATAYRIESDIPVSAYQYNPLDNTGTVWSNDASLLFPTHSLGGEYTAVTSEALWIGTDEGTDNAGAFVSVVATADGTTIDLYPTADLYPGAYNGVMLDRGQVFTAISDGSHSFPAAVGDGNLSGTRISADQPVAVFSGNVAAYEPQQSNGFADHIEHQMLPLEAWGTGYIAAPPPATVGSGVDRAGYRITGAFDGTELVYSPSKPSGAPATIDAQQTVRFETDQPFSVLSSGGEPFAVTQFLLNSKYLQPTPPTFNAPGDPAMISLPSREQYLTASAFLVPMGYDINWIVIVAPTGTEATVDDTPVSGFSPAANLGGIPFSVAYVELDPGAHVITATEPVQVIAVGYADAVSYGYPAGSGLNFISMPPPVPAG